ncbi:MAG TPA: ABC transporter substrate-binding protein [Acidimicrobiales bacterium]|nr:ABC transporter substrate-binding protein [Acidimicrobiales bacterium]
MGNGASGAIQMAAVYDTLMRYDLESKTYKPLLAESLTGNADSTEWTLKLRSGIKFTDRTDLNAEAVQYSLQRHRVGTPNGPKEAQCAEYVACPRNTRATNVYVALINDVQVVDPLTLKINLSEAWASFPYTFSTEPGIPLTVATAKEDKVNGFSSIDQAGEIILMNQGVTINCLGGKPEPLCVGKPDGQTPTTPATANLKVRQAIAAAYNPTVFNERVYSGKGLPDTALFQSSFPWDPGVAGPKHDLELAKKFVAEAKTEGWNGTVRVVFTNSANDQNAAVALEGMLRAAGINATVDTSKESTAQQQVVTTLKDFDMARWGTSIGPDDSAIWAIAQNLTSTSTSNRPGFKSTKVDQAVKDLRAAKTDDAKKAAYKVIAEEYNAQLPWINFTAVETLKAFSPKVHGVTASHRNKVYFDKAWMEK